jgi:hypothetical protein
MRLIFQSILVFVLIYSTFEEESRSIIATRPQQPPLRKQSSNYLGAEPSAGLTVFFGITEDEEEVEAPGQFARQQTSLELIEALSKNDASVLNDKEKISAFIQQLRSGQIVTKKPSEFRKKRLTYEHQDAGSVPSDPSSARKDSIPARKLSSKMMSAADLHIKSTIFAANEIGARQDRPPPFPVTTLGTFSCHGIEPGEDEDGEDVVYDKINQDRGCVVCPYHSSYEEALFLVLDGHGEQGDRISEFAMRQVPIFIT